LYIHRCPLLSGIRFGTHSPILGGKRQDKPDAPLNGPLSGIKNWQSGKAVHNMETV
jgi:hypothetical protein